MKSFLLLITLCLYLLANFQTLLADRTTSMQVVERLKNIEPKHAAIKRRIINFVYATKLSLVQRTDEFYRQLFAIKEGSLIDSIALEDELLFHLDRQPQSTDRSCLAMLRTIVDSNMNVAGVGYTNCINTVETGLDRELKRARKLLKLNEFKIFYQRLLDVFEGENIITGPERILAKLDSKSFEIDAFGSDCLSGVSDIVEKFTSALLDLRNAYLACLNTNEAILKLAYEAATSQLTNICLGTINAPKAVERE